MSVFSNDIDLNILLHGLERHSADLPQESAERIRQAIHDLPDSQPELITLLTQDEHLDRLYEKALADRRSGYMVQERAKSLEISTATPITAEMSQMFDQLAGAIDRLLTKRQSLSTSTATKQLLKTLERSHLTTEDLKLISNYPQQQTQAILQDLWRKGYIEKLSASALYIIFPGLRSPQYRASFPSDDAFLTLTARGYFHLYPLIARTVRKVSA
jgi:hypothetical protein